MASDDECYCGSVFGDDCGGCEYIRPTQQPATPEYQPMAFARGGYVEFEVYEFRSDKPILESARCVAACTSNEAQQAALRLLNTPEKETT